MTKASSRILVFNYHAVFATRREWETYPPADRWYSVLGEQFASQMQALASLSARTALLSEFLAGEAPQRSVVLTFDDGHESNRAVALPILQRHGFRAEFFITVAHIGRPGFVTWDDLRTMMAAGMSVQSHGLHHSPLTDLPSQALKDELRTSRELLEQNLGREVKYLAVPGGFVDRRVYDAALEAGYAAICNSEPGVAKRGLVIPRIAIMHSTTDRDFSGLIQRSPVQLFRMRAQRKFGRVAKALIGVKRYEALKRRALPKAE